MTETEWPQWYSLTGERDGRDEIQVIPADLGRELYEALRDLHRMIRYQGDEPQVDALLLRYEQEVGNG